MFDDYIPKPLHLIFPLILYTVAPYFWLWGQPNVGIAFFLTGGVVTIWIGAAGILREAGKFYEKMDDALKTQIEVAEKFEAKPIKFFDGEKTIELPAIKPQGSPAPTEDYTKTDI